MQRPRPLAERLRNAAEATWVAGEETALRAMRLAAALAGEIGDAAAPCPVHGDCSADQFVAGDAGLSLVDLDAAAYDDPTADLASVAADLEARVVRGELMADAASGALAALLAAYAGAGGTGRRSPGGRSSCAPPRRCCCAPRSRSAAARTAGTGAPRRSWPAPRRSPGRARPGRPCLPATEPAAGTLRGLEAPPVAEEAAAALRIASGPLALRRAWPRGADALALEYRSADGLVVAAQWHADAGRFEQLCRETPQPCATVEVPGGRELLLQAHGADRRLAALRGIAARPGAVLLGHRAERRAVVRTADTFVKVVPPERAARVAAAAAHATALAARAGLRAPALVDAEPAAGVVCFAALEGTPLREALGGAGAADALRATGRALRRLHASRAPAALPVHDAAAEVAVLERWVADLVAHADGHPLARDAAGRLPAVAAALTTEPPCPPGLLHRDLHDGQVLLAPDGTIALLDADTLARGEPALDLGNLVAHLERFAPGPGRGHGRAARRLRPAGGHGAAPERLHGRRAPAAGLRLRVPALTRGVAVTRSGASSGGQCATSSSAVNGASGSRSRMREATVGAGDRVEHSPDEAQRHVGRFEYLRPAIGVLAAVLAAHRALRLPQISWTGNLSGSGSSIPAVDSAGLSPPSQASRQAPRIPRSR